MTVQLTQAHIEEVRRIVADTPHLTVRDLSLSAGGTQVIVTIEPLKYNPQTTIGHLYAQMRDRGTRWYAVSHSNAPDWAVEALTFMVLP